MKKKVEKRVDCIELKRRAHERINRATQGMTPREEADYFQRAAESGPLGKWWKSLRGKAAASPPTRPSRRRAI